MSPAPQKKKKKKNPRLVEKSGLRSSLLMLLSTFITWFIMFLKFQIGYCPQFDALLEFLTVQEHLELYGRIKGVPDYKLDDVCST